MALPGLRNFTLMKVLLKRDPTYEMQPGPAPDAYLHNTMVPRHFSKTPKLKSLPPDCYLKKTLGPRVGVDIHALLNWVYTRHELKHCPKMGLYYVGWEEWEKYDDCEKIIVLVVEMTSDQIGRWRVIDADVMDIVKSLRFAGMPRIPMRYYVSPGYPRASRTVGVPSTPPVRPTESIANTWEQYLGDLAWDWNYNWMRLGMTSTWQDGTLSTTRHRQPSPRAEMARFRAETARRRRAEADYQNIVASARQHAAESLPIVERRRIPYDPRSDSWLRDDEMAPAIPRHGH